MGWRGQAAALTASPWLPHSPLAGIEPTGNMVKKRAEFTVETRSAGQGEVLVYVEDPAGHQEEVWQAGRALRSLHLEELFLPEAHGFFLATGKGDCQ